MAWCRNFYHCNDCGELWEDEWSCSCDDDCPACGSRHWSPYQCDDLSVTVERDGSDFLVLHSAPEVEEHQPRYQIVARLPDRLLAEAIAEALTTPLNLD
jgi:hypothetical protein